MKNNKRNNRVPHLIRPKKIELGKDNSGFASTQSYVNGVTKIYSQEIKDIDRFVKFAESHLSKSK